MAAVSLQPAFAAEVLTDDTVDETVPAEESGLPVTSTEHGEPAAQEPAPAEEKQTEQIPADEEKSETPEQPETEEIEIPVEEEKEPLPSYVRAAVTEDTPVIAMFGDSITRGSAGHGVTVSEKIPKIIGKCLGVTCDNYGVSYMGWLRTVPDTGQRAYDKISSTDLSPYNTFVLCYGVNDDKTPDLILGDWDSEDPGTVVGQMRKCIQYLFSEKPDCRMIIVAPFITANDKRGAMRETFRLVAEDYGIPYIDQDDSPVNASTVSEALTDGIHPTEEYHLKLGYWLSSRLREILEIRPDISRASAPLKSSYAFTGTGIRPLEEVTLRVDGNNITLENGTDYTLSYSNNKNVGTATVTLRGIGDYQGTLTKTFGITAVKLASLKVKYPAMQYSGSCRTQSKAAVVTANINGTAKKLTYEKDYTVSYKNNRKVGIATMTVTGTGNFTGTISKTFKIIPAGTTIAKITPGEKMLTVAWRKQKVQADGCQIMYSTDSKFRTCKTAAASSSRYFRRIIGLKANTKYYLKVRTYKKVDGRTIYSEWSEVQTARTAG